MYNLYSFYTFFPKKILEKTRDLIKQIDKRLKKHFFKNLKTIAIITFIKNRYLR